MSEESINNLGGTEDLRTAGDQNPEEEGIVYVDTTTGNVHKFGSTKEKMEWLDEKQDPSNK